MTTFGSRPSLRFMTPLLRSMRCPAAIDGQCRAGDRRGQITGEKHRECAHLLDCREALVGLLCQENVANDLVARNAVRLCLVVDLLLDQRRPDIAWTDRVCGHAMFGALERGHLRQPDDAMLSCNVGRGDEAMSGRDVDNAAKASRLHALEDRLCCVKDRREIERDDRVPALHWE